MRCIRVTSLIVPLFLLLGACSSSSDSTSDGSPSSVGGSGGNGGATSQPASGENVGGQSGGESSPGIGISLPQAGSGGATTSGSELTCGLSSYQRESRRADVMIVLDRSSSMENVPKGSKVNKWEMLVPAVKEVVTSTNETIDWGLKFYPEGEDLDSCVPASIVPTIHVPVAKNQASELIKTIDAEGPNGHGTPTAQAVGYAADHLRSLAKTSDNKKFILLATDGEPNCANGANALDLTVTAIENALEEGFPTFVIGVDTTSASTIENLNEMAKAGGRPREASPGEPLFYLASTQSELDAALRSITTEVASCIFDLDPVPPVPENIAVDFNGVRATRDATMTNGWEYTKSDYSQLEVYGAFCDRIKSESKSKVEIRYGCPNVEIPPPQVLQ